MRMCLTLQLNQKPVVQLFELAKQLKTTISYSHKFALDFLACESRVV